MKNRFRRLFKASLRARKIVTAAVVLSRLVLPHKSKPLKCSTAKRMPKTRGVLAPRDHRPAPGTFADGMYSGAYGKLAYKLYTPAGSSRRKLPLVVMLHGCQQTAADFAAGTGMNKIADELGFLVLYPQQPVSSNLGRCWNWHRPGDQKRGAGEPAKIAALTRQVMHTSKANSARVYIAGISAGGAAAAIVAAAYPDLFVAVGVQSGLVAGSVKTVREAVKAMRSGSETPVAAARGKATPVPTIVFHGDQDKIVHPANAAGFLRSLGRLSEDPLVGKSEAGRSKGGRKFIRSEYRRGAGAVLLENWEIHGAGHGWSGGSSAGSFTDPAGPDASREMVRFFFERRRPR